MNKSDQITKLEKIKKILIKKIIEISYLSKAHHIGPELSCIDLLVVLYFYYLKINPKKPQEKNRDHFIMSKGHAALALYLVLMKKNFFSEKYLIDEFLTNGGNLGGHPDKNIKHGIEVSSGSLGQGLSIGAGLSLASKKDNLKSKSVVLVGDGELNEGMIWEAVMFSSHKRLDNLICIVDKNNLQGLGSTKSVNNLNSLSSKFKEFGWNTYEINGHDTSEIMLALDKCSKKKGKPHVIIANTIKGNGISKMQNKLSSHYQVLSKELYEEALKEISK